MQQVFSFCAFCQADNCFSASDLLVSSQTLVIVNPTTTLTVGNTYTLISGTGIPSGAPQVLVCYYSETGCPDNRVLIVNESGNIVWQYGQAGVTGFALNELNAPVQSLILTNFPGHSGTNVLITDQGNQRVILVNMNKQIVWQYGTTGVAGNGFNELNSPNSA